MEFLPKNKQSHQSSAFNDDGFMDGSDFTNDDLVQETKLVEEYNLELITDSETFLIILTPKEDAVSLWGK